VNVRCRRANGRGRGAAVPTVEGVSTAARLLTGAKI
jgi:hypothetical protein